MRHKKTYSLILLTLLMLITISPFSIANPSGGPIIWSAERQFTFDPTFTYWEPEPPPGHWETIYYTDIDMMPSITATRDNTIWIAWQTDETGNDEIFYKYRWNGIWINDTQLTFNPSNDFGPAILETLDNKIWVFWASDRTGNDEIFYKTTSNNGDSWSTETNATYDPRSDVSPAVAQANDGKIWLVWARRTATNNQDIFYKTYDGISWTDETQLTTNTNLDELPSVDQATDGKIWVFWSQFMPDGYQQLWCKNFDGSTWSSETQLTTETKDHMDPSAFVEKDGTIWVFYQVKEQRTSATWDIFYKISLDNGNTWSSPAQFTSDSSDDTDPSAVQAPDKSLWVVWTSNRLDSNGNNNVDLYVKVSLLGDINQDGIIDMTDLNTIKRAMPSTPSDARWNPECDLNIDNQINILDLVIASVNYGSTV